MVDQISFFFTSVPFDTVLSFFLEYQLLIALTMPLVFGELGLYLFGMLLGMDGSFYPAVILSLLSIVFYDTLVYITVQFLKKRYTASALVAKVPFLANINRVFTKCEKEYRGHSFFLLLAIKTLPLTKVIIFFYAFRQTMSISRFIVRDMCATVIWASAIIVPGWLVGRGMLTFSEGQSISVFILYFILFLIVMLFLGKYTEKLLFWAMRVMSRRS